MHGYACRDKIIYGSNAVDRDGANFWCTCCTVPGRIYISSFVPYSSLLNPNVNIYTVVVRIKRDVINHSKITNRH